MSDKDARFRRLAPSGDLFAHFGVSVEAPAVQSPRPVVRAAAACTHCGWYVDVLDRACPVCAKPTARAL